MSRKVWKSIVPGVELGNEEGTILLKGGTKTKTVEREGRVGKMESVTCLIFELNFLSWIDPLLFVLLYLVQMKQYSLSIWWGSQKHILQKSCWSIRPESNSFTANQHGHSLKQSSQVHKGQHICCFTKQKLQQCSSNWYPDGFVLYLWMETVVCWRGQRKKHRERGKSVE